MKAQVTFKYKPGQTVTLTHCPSFENMQLLKYVYEKDFKPKDYRLAGYKYVVDEDGVGKKFYNLYAYCDEYIQYHNWIPEEHLDGEANEHVVGINFVTERGEDINIGDRVYSGIYSSSISGPYVYPYLTFVKYGPVIGFTYTKEVTFLLNDEMCESVRLEATIDNGDTNYNKTSEYVQHLLKEIDDNFIVDYVRGCRKHRFNPTKEPEEHDNYATWLKRMGIYERVCEEYKKKKNYKKKPSSGKKVTTKDKISDIISGLTEKEKAEMLKQLTKK